jgi:hypothetical protein
MGRHQPNSEVLPNTVAPCYAFGFSAVSALTVAATMIAAHVHPLPDCPQIVQDGVRALHMGGAAATTAFLTTATLIAADNMVGKKEGRFFPSLAGTVLCELALIAEGIMAESGYTKAGALLAACIAPIIAGAVDLHRKDHEFFFNNILKGRQRL